MLSIPLQSSELSVPSHELAKSSADDTTRVYQEPLTHAANLALKSSSKEDDSLY